MSKNAQILLENLIEQEFQNNDNYSNISDYFEFFSASQILKNQGLSDDEVDNGIVGKGLDGGCDSIYLFLNNLLYKKKHCSKISKQCINRFIFIWLNMVN